MASVHSQISDLIQQNLKVNAPSMVYEVAKCLPMYEKNLAWLESREMQVNQTKEYKEQHLNPDLVFHPQIEPLNY